MCKTCARWHNCSLDSKPRYSKIISYSDPLQDCQDNVRKSKRLLTMFNFRQYLPVMPIELLYLISVHFKLHEMILALHSSQRNIKPIYSVQIQKHTTKCTASHHHGTVPQMRHVSTLSYQSVPCSKCEQPLQDARPVRHRLRYMYSTLGTLTLYAQAAY